MNYRTLNTNNLPTPNLPTPNQSPSPTPSNLHLHRHEQLFCPVDVLLILKAYARLKSAQTARDNLETAIKEEPEYSATTRQDRHYSEDPDG